MRIVNICNRTIEYSFYSLFFFVPLAFASNTSELFEFNKMWLTYGISIVIAGAWGIKTVLQKEIAIQRTPLDIPIQLFLISQVISTIFSWDSYVSFWGYYSRFNGGLLSIITYIFLYYAFLSNLNAISMVKRLLFVSLLSGLVVVLWGLPSHFGYDPTCLLLRGTLDASCWTEDFQPMVRIFSTLGQPAWLAAYLAILIPLSITMFIDNSKSPSRTEAKNQKSKIKNQKFSKSFIFAICYLIFAILFYLALLYTNTRSGFLAIWLSLAFFFANYLWLNRKKFYILNSIFYILLVLGVITFFIGQPFSQLDKFTFKAFPQIEKTDPQTQENFSTTGGGTESGEIRKIVWQGAVNVWKTYPVFGTGVETFAFAYYKYKPPEHNLTSEWNFLYNKAHNEYLNYLATTGIFGLGSYVLMIGWFLLRPLRFVMLNSFQHLNQMGSRNKFGMTEKDNTLILALLASYISILITNFFGFSVVITNIYLFLIPAFVFVLGGMINPEKIFVFPRNESRIKNQELRIARISPYQWAFIFSIILASLFLILNLIKFWTADANYALGQNLDKVGQYQEAASYLRRAVSIRGEEPVFKDALSVNDANNALDLLNSPSSDEPDTTQLASTFAQEAINLSNELTSNHPNNLVFWKNRVRVFYTLSQLDSRYLEDALSAIKKAANLAPNDASISYNLGIIYGQTGDIKNGISALEKTVKLKPDYRDAYYALGLFYREEAVDKNGKVSNYAFQEKAVEQMQYILDHLSPNDPDANEALENWKKS